MSLFFQALIKAASAEELQKYLHAIKCQLIYKESQELYDTLKIPHDIDPMNFVVYTDTGFSNNYLMYYYVGQNDIYGVVGNYKYIGHIKEHMVYNIDALKNEMQIGQYTKDLDVNKEIENIKQLKWTDSVKDISTVQYFLLGYCMHCNKIPKQLKIVSRHISEK